VCRGFFKDPSIMCVSTVVVVNSSALAAAAIVVAEVVVFGSNSVQRLL